MSTSAVAILESIARIRSRLLRSPMVHRRLEALQQWQVQRLQATYEDFHRMPRYRAAIDFFLQDLYGPHDFRARDRDLTKVLHTWQKALPPKALEALTRALELEALTQDLDLAMLDALGDAPLSEYTYAQAYRQVNRRGDRERQIALILACGQTLDSLVRRPWVRAALHLARTPARLAGVTALHEFLEHGCAAFARMRNAQELLRAIEQRETTIMRNMLSGSAAPFSVP